MSIPRTAQVGPLAAAVSNGYAQSQSGTANTPLTLNGSLVNAAGVGVPDTPRRVIITSAGNDASITFMITGQMYVNGPIVTEVMQGTSGAATNLQGQAWSMLDYIRVISIVPSGNTASTVTAGTNGVASTNWFRLDNYGFPPVAFEVTVSGTVNFMVEEAMRDPNIVTGAPTPNVGPATITPAQLIWQPHATVASKTANAFDQFSQVPTWTRCTLNSQTNPGFAVFTVSQPVSALTLSN